ncbi:carboxypeptidase-like regulatory domain-containing protein [Porphyromonas cangingivalis]|uniref:carboxypeptidase-like regulatory domain-containing protein n=1 Tax=Porphyromonas cangingivalis TaxID=36874 RepID=UPI00068411DF|nr:carboxypeptidase-like regulatory domain-containing protein [Porphyromonas cangingivalis]
MTHRVSKLSKCLKVVLLFVLMCPVRFAVAQQSGQRTLSGTVYDDERLPLIGAVIKVEGSKTVTGTKADGTYSIKVPIDKDVVLLVSFVGLQTSRVVIPKGTTDVKKDISLQGDTKLKEVIVTGIYTRPLGSYTGSATTIKGDEIRKVGGQNLLQSLKNVDPSIYLRTTFRWGQTQ